MEILRNVADLRTWRRAKESQGLTIGFVPTMGFLHSGHLELCRRAKAVSQRVIVSIFINPLQFGPKEDLSRYPRDESGDLAKLQSEGVDAVFLPSVEEMYPPGFSTEVQVMGLTDRLCGSSRPGHFKGVTTVVARLFNLVTPHYALFGEKDFQQLQVIRKMVFDLGMDILVVGVPTVREPDGLAMSSRNVLLSPQARLEARRIPQALHAAHTAWKAGNRDPAVIRDQVEQDLRSSPQFLIDYVTLVDASTLQAPNENPPFLIAVAIRIDTTRLIDNLILE